MELAPSLASPKEDSLRRLDDYRKWLEYLAWLGVKVEKPQRMHSPEGFGRDE